MSRDLRQALRRMRARPLLTAVVVLALALASGFTTAVFSLVDGWLLRALPYAEADRLVHIWEDDADAPQAFGLATDAVVDLLAHEMGTLELVALQHSRGATPTELRVPSPLVHEVSASYFRLLGTEPLHGRLFSPEEYLPGGPRRVILSYDFWQRHLGGDEGIVGGVLELDFEPWEVVGILAPDFHGPIQREPPQLFMPLALDPATFDFAPRRYLAYGRLAPGATLSAARAELERIGGELAAAHPETHGGRRLRLESLQEVLVGPLRPALWTVFAAGACVLLVAGCNVANLLLARALAGGRELSLRAALGASRRDLLRQLLVESLTLTLAGGALGVAIAAWALRVLAASIPPEPGRPWLGLVSVDARVLAFALLVAIAIGLVFAFLEAHQGFARLDLAGVLRAAGARATSGAGRGLLRASLVVLETALALVLLVGAGLTIRSFLHAQGRDPGFATKNVLTLRTALRGPEYETGAQRTAFFERVLAALRAQPAVAAAAVITRPPPSLALGTVGFEVEGAPAELGHEPQAQLLVVSPDLFAALSVPLVRGRAFSLHDDAQSEPVAIVSRGLAERYLDGRDPLTAQLHLRNGKEATRRVVGVVGDVRTAAQPPDPAPTIYLPHAQQADGVMSYVIRTRTDADVLAPELVRVIAEQDPLMPLYRVTTMEESLASVDWQPRFTVRLLAFLAAVGLFLAATGLYAVMAFNIAERRRELVIRTALGARPADVLGLVLGHAAILVLVGLGTGLAAALAGTRLIAAQLHGVEPRDPATYALVALFLALVGLGASGAAARKALAVDPAAALREE